MSDRRVYIYVNGIMTLPGDSRNWNGRAVTHTHILSPWKAEKIEYFTGPVSRVFGQKKRARKLSRTMEYYHGWRIVLVGHSNGCDVICDALRLNPTVPVQELHLLSAACEADFQKNGLNGLNIPRICVYIAKRDQALKLASLKVSRLLGYGVLGKTGPLRVRPDQRLAVFEEDFGHSGWFEDEHFDTTMDRILMEADFGVTD